MATYTLISSTVLSTLESSVTFSSIPATYTDLVLRITARAGNAAIATGVSVSFNGNSTTSYSDVSVSGNGTTAASFLSSDIDSSAIGVVSADSTTANTFGSLEIYIPSYTASQSKPFSGSSAAENNSTTAVRRNNAALFRSNTAISSITLSIGFGFLAGSSFYLYGISNA